MNVAYVSLPLGADARACIGLRTKGSHAWRATVTSFLPPPASCPRATAVRTSGDLVRNIAQPVFGRRSSLVRLASSTSTATSRPYGDEAPDGGFIDAISEVASERSVPVAVAVERCVRCDNVVRQTRCDPGQGRLTEAPPIQVVVRDVDGDSDVDVVRSVPHPRHGHPVWTDIGAADRAHVRRQDVRGIRRRSDRPVPMT